MMLVQIIIFAAIAVFVLFRLYSVLGKGVGAPPPKAATRPAAKINKPGATSKSSAKPARLRIAFDGPAAAGLESIRNTDADFDPERFLLGARMAYERIVEAYSKGDRKALKALLQASVYTRYAQAIEERAKAGRVLETKIIQIKKADIKTAVLKGRRASIVVAFEVEISTKESTGQEDQEPRVVLSTTTEEWTFVRDVRSRDPNWKLDGVASLA